MIFVGLLWLRRKSGSSTNQKVIGLIPSSSHLHVKVSLGKVLNPESPPVHPLESECVVGKNCCGTENDLWVNEACI